MKKLRLLFVLSIVLFSCSKKDSTPAPPPPTPAAPTISSFSPDTASAGMDVIIQGTNFSTDISKNIVKFNGIVGDVKTATTTSITATVPNGAKAGNITVTVNGQTTTSAHTLSVLGGSWLQRADYGGNARGWAAGFSIGGKGYV